MVNNIALTILCKFKAGARKCLLFFFESVQDLSSGIWMQKVLMPSLLSAQIFPL